jgi:hypothetical protein
MFGQEKKQTYDARPSTLEERRERRQNRVIKEWNTEGKRKWMDRLTVWDPEGRKIEDIEYASYGQKERVVLEYEGDDLKCVREIVYNDKNKVIRIRKFEYNPDGSKKTQYNYLPNGKLFSVKIFEYSYK